MLGNLTRTRRGSRNTWRLGSLCLLVMLLSSQAQTNTDVQIGRHSAVRQWGGTNEVTGDLVLLGGGRYELIAGTLICSNIVAFSEFSIASSQYYQGGGVLELKGDLRVGRYCGVHLEGGTLNTRAFTMQAGAFVGHSGGVINNPGTFVIDSGYFVTVGQPAPYGALRVTNAFLVFADPSPTIMFATNDPCIVRFADSRHQTWHGEAVLDIKRWDGLTTGGGRTRLLFGEDANGLSPAQVSRIRFRDPAGFPPGVYYARMLTTGEVVPTEQPTLTWSPASAHLVLDWPGLFTLQVATNVAGPYTDMPNSQAPSAQSYQPHRARFFRLRAQ